jgi:hypothetical protein
MQELINRRPERSLFLEAEGMRNKGYKNTVFSRILYMMKEAQAWNRKKKA